MRRCHGANGISTTKGVPHLAGQRAGYLYLQLRAYRHGARVQSAMTGAVKFLSDDALVKVAAYYASLDPPQPAAASAKGGAARPDPVQAGKAAAASLRGCHGEIGVSKTPGMPSLVGLDPKYLVAAMKAYKSGQRKNDMMKSMIGSLGDERRRLNNIALYYALQKPARAQDAGRRRRRRRARRPPPPAPGATATRGSAAIPRRRASPVRTRSTWSRRWAPTRTDRARTRR